MKLLKMLWHFEHAVVHWSHLFTAKPRAGYMFRQSSVLPPKSQQEHTNDTLDLAYNKVFWLSSWGAVRCQALREHQVHRHNTEF